MSETTPLRDKRARVARLFACTCARRIWPLLKTRARKTIAAAERYAEGEIDEKKLAAARKSAGAVYGSDGPEDIAANVASYTALPSATAGSYAVVEALPALGDKVAPEWLEPVQAEIYGPEKVTIDPAWLAWDDGTVTKLAGAIYEEKAFDRLPILADALEEAGCHDEAILGHCRGQGEHVRGCWVLDFVLGKR